MSNKDQNEYLTNLFAKFNANKEDPELNDAERMLLISMEKAESKIVNLTKQVNAINDNIKKLQAEANNIMNEIVACRGETQGYVNALVGFHSIAPSSELTPPRPKPQAPEPRVIREDAPKPSSKRRKAQ